ncbi:MAG: NAD(P)-dependent oxidoreductase, partial [Comamonadaceae bacterium]
MTFNCIGFIGVGVMGEPMCRHLATKSGLQVLASDTAPEPLERLAASGVQAVAQDVMLARADIVFLSLPSGAVVEAVMLGPQGLLARARAGQTFVDLSTSPYDTARRLFEAAVASGVHVADAPVMRTRAAAEAGTLAVMVGATPAVFDAIAPLIRTFASEVMHVGGAGAGQVVKILNNMVVYETVLALAEARAIATRVGMDAET